MAGSPTAGAGGPTDAAQKRRKQPTGPKPKAPAPGTCICTPPWTGSHAWPTPQALPNETSATTIGFWARARAFFAAHGIHRITRVITDNGSNYRAKNFNRSILATAARHQRIRPHTPKHNGKVERYNRTLAEELLYAREWTSEPQRAAAITTWNIHYNYHRAHTAIGNRPPAARLHQAVTNVMTQNT